MKRNALLLLCLALALAPVLSTAAVLRVYTPFADMDPGAQGWEELVRAWEEETGNACEDYSALQDEPWFEALRRAVGAGEADLVVLPVGSGLGAKDLVPAEELSQAGAAGVRSLAAMAEKDGSVLLTPVRFHFETLFVNTDVLEKAGLAAPESWEDLVVACAVLSQTGVTPIANALTEWPEIVLDCAAMMGAPAAEFGSEASKEGAALVLSQLVAVGAFGQDPWNAEDQPSAEAFLSGKAAMRFDSWDFSLSVPEERRDAVRVIALPGLDGERRTALVGTPACGLALTQTCRQDPEKWKAALSLAQKILGAEGESGLVTAAGGKLAESMAELTMSAQDVSGILYDRDPEGFDDWAERVISGLMGE